MNDDRFSVLLATAVVPNIARAAGFSTLREVEDFYRSRLFRLVSDQYTSMWHLSPVLLAELYREERETGCFDVPEEQS